MLDTILIIGMCLRYPLFSILLILLYDLSCLSCGNKTLEDGARLASANNLKKSTVQHKKKQC